MARTKKVGITGRFGARYGRKAKRSVKNIEENMKKAHICPKCDRPYVKRQSAGIWKCKKMWKCLYWRSIRTRNTNGKIRNT